MSALELYNTRKRLVGPEVAVSASIRMPNREGKPELRLTWRDPRDAA